MFDTVSSGACENLRNVINKMKISPGQCMPTSQAAVCYLPRVIQSSPPFACLASFDLIKGQAVIDYELKHIERREGLLKLEHFKNT